jgi:hypothetical protein
MSAAFSSSRPWSSPRPLPLTYPSALFLSATSILSFVLSRLAFKLYPRPLSRHTLLPPWICVRAAFSIDDSIRLPMSGCPPCLSYFVAAFVSSVLTVGHCHAVPSIVLDTSRQQNVSATLFLCQRLVSATRSSTSTTYFHAFLVQSPVSRNKPLANRSLRQPLCVQVDNLLRLRFCPCQRL